MNLPSRDPARKTVRGLLADQSGGAAMLGALVLPIVIGFVGLGVSVGVWIDAKRDIQTQADAGALSGKNDQMAGKTTTVMNTSIGNAVTLNGSSTVTCPSAGCTVTYPTVGPLGDANAVKVNVTKSQPLFFAALINGLNVNVSATATAEARKTGEACLLALDPDASGYGVKLWGSATINLTNCVIAANQVNASAVGAGGNATVYAQSVYTAGGYTQGGSADMVSHFTTNPITGAPPLADPYANLGSADPILTAIHAAAPTCDAAHTNYTVGPSSTQTISPGTWCGNFRVQGTLTMNPGVYYLYQGNLTVNAGASLTGTGVTIVMTTRTSQPGSVGGVSINGNSTMRLSAPPINTTLTALGVGSTNNANFASFYYGGVVFYYDRLATGNPTLTFNGGDNMNLTGSVYAPKATLDFLGNSGASASNCTKLVAYDIQFTGNVNSTLNTSGCAAVLGTTGDTSIYEVVLSQ